MLNELKNLNLDRYDEEGIVALLAFGENLAETYKKNDLEAPDWLAEKLTSLRKEIVSRRRDNIERALKNAKARREALRTAEEKRNDLDKSIAALEAKLNA